MVLRTPCCVPNSSWMESIAARFAGSSSFARSSLVIRIASTFELKWLLNLV